MRSLSIRLLLSLTVLVLAPSLFAHDVTLTGAQSFASLDGSSSDHDGAANGVFTVNDGNLIVSGTVNCNDDGPGSNSACAMAFSVSGEMIVNAGGALYAENRNASGSGGAISLTVGGDLTHNGIISSAAKTSASGDGGAITANVGGVVTLVSGSTIDSGSAKAKGGTIAIAAGGSVSVAGNVLSGPSGTLLATKLNGQILDGGNPNQQGGRITISSTTFAGPAIAITSTANVVSQGEKDGAGPVTLDGCGVDVAGLVAAVSIRDSPAVVIVRSGRGILIDGRDLNGAGLRFGRVRADALQDGATNDRVDLFARDSVSILGPPGAGTTVVVSSVPGAKGNKDSGGTVRVISLDGGVSVTGRAIIAGADGKGTRGGTISIAAADDVNLDGAIVSATGDISKPKNGSAGGHIEARSWSGDVLWRNGTGDVRPVGSTSGVPLADQGTIVLTACGTVDTTGSSYPVNGVATSMFPETHTGVCSPAAPSLPAGVPALGLCNNPPVANDTSATTNEDTTVTILLSGSDADGDSLTFSIVSGPANGSLGAIIPTGPTTATVDYSPDPNFNGGDSFVFQVDDGNGGTDNGTVTITVNPVNDPPSFLAGPTVTVLEDSGAQTYPNWATAISPGPADESGQTVTFIVTNDNPALFSVQPAVSSNGTLTFTPAANAFGSATITVTAQDDGGIANGGDDTSNPQSSSITVTPVNDEPSFTGGGNVTVNEDSGSYSAPWATAISAGPANESSQNVTFNVSNDNNALFAVQPAISPSGVLTFTPATNAFGSAIVTVFLTDDGGIANGGDDTSPSQTFVITVNAVNDEPSFTGGGNVTVNEDSGSYSAPWATAISAGPANESSQNVTFNVSNDNNALFAVQPAISPSGVLTFTPATDAFGSATVTVFLTDDGGIANGGDDTSPSQMFVITVNAVNDAPSFTPGGDVTVNEDSGPYAAPWATSISAGPANESGQTVMFLVSNNNNALFLVQPSISPAGILSFTPAPNAFGSATVTVALKDNGGIANGGVDTSASVQFTINVTAGNDGPTAVNDSWDTLGNTELRVDLAGGLTPKISDTTTSGNGVRDNDSDPDGDPVIVTGIVGCSDVTAPFDCTLGDGSKISMLANGSFSYTPGPGNTTGSFQYTVTDVPAFGSPASSTGTATINIFDMIWYVNGSAVAGGNGTSIAPFNSFAPVNGAGDADDSGDTIFVHTSLVSGSIDMEANEKLWGEGVGLATNFNLNGNGSPQVLVAPGVKPSVISGGDTVTVTGVAGVDIAGLALTSSAGNGIDVTSNGASPATGATIRENTIVAAALEGIDVNAAAAAGTTVLVSNTSISSAGNGLDVTSIGPAVASYDGGTITSTGGIGIRMDGTVSGNLTVSGLSNVTIDGNTAASGITVTVAKFDAIAGGSFDTVNGGALAVGSAGNPVGGAGVVLANVSGDYAIGTLTVFASTSGVTVGGTGLFTGAAGMRITNGGGSISAPAGVGLSVTSATIGAADLKFTSINATGGVNGIALNNTGTVGGLAVSGTGTADGSGGTISGTSGDGVLLVSTANVRLTNMIVGDATATDVQNADALSSIGGDGIDATNVTPGPGTYGLNLENVKLARVSGNGILGQGGNVGFRLSNSEILNAGDAINEHAMNFGSGFSANATMLAGSVDISNSIIAATAQHGFFVENAGGGTMTMTVTGSTFRNNDDATFCGSTCEGNGLQVIADGSPGPGTPTINLTVQNTTFTEIDQDSIDAIADPGGVIDLNVLNTTHNSPNGDNAVRIASGSPGDDAAVTFDIADIVVQAMRGTIIQLRGANTLEGRITTQSLAQNLLDAGAGVNLGRGIEIIGDGDSAETPKITILVENTKIRRVGVDGMLIDGSDVIDPTSFMNITVRNNVMGELPGEGVEVRSRQVFAVNLLLENNSISTTGTGVSSEAVDLDAENSASMVATLLGNSMTTASVSTNAFRADTEAATSSFCLDLNAANTNPNTASNGYTLTRIAGSVFSVEGLGAPSNGAATAAFLQTRNIGTVSAVDGGGTFSVSVGCNLPPLPANP